MDSALGYADRGWHVFPCWWPGLHRPCACSDPECGSPAKHPHGALVPRGLHQALADPKAIRAWWSLLPQANVAVRTGSVSSLVVLDVDGKEGQASLLALTQTHGPLRAAWAKTGSGGWHGCMAYPGSAIANSAGKLGLGLDVRGDGGYVIAPPSLHVSGQRYAWRRDVPPDDLPAMPAWLVELLVPPTPTTPVAPQAPKVLKANGLRPADRGHAYGIAALKAEAIEVSLARQKTRNNRLFLAAARLGELVGSGLLDESGVLSNLLDAARFTSLSDREAEATIRSGLRHGQAQPRGVTL